MGMTATESRRNQLYWHRVEKLLEPIRGLSCPSAFRVLFVQQIESRPGYLSGSGVSISAAVARHYHQAVKGLWHLWVVRMRFRPPKDDRC
jgi:hypothetical protein